MHTCVACSHDAEIGLERFSVLGEGKNHSFYRPIRINTCVKQTFCFACVSFCYSSECLRENFNRFSHFSSFARVAMMALKKACFIFAHSHTDRFHRLAVITLCENPIMYLLLTRPILCVNGFRWYVRMAAYVMCCFCCLKWFFFSSFANYLSLSDFFPLWMQIEITERYFALEIIEELKACANSIIIFFSSFSSMIDFLSAWKSTSVQS